MPLRSVPLHNVSEIQAALAAAGLDAAIVMLPRNIWCLTGYPFWSAQRPGATSGLSAAAIAYPTGEPTLVTSRYTEELSLMRSWVQDITSFGDYVESPLSRVADVLRRRRLASGRIGIESNYLTAEYADDLAEGLQGGQIVPCDDLLASTWVVKQAAELNVMRRNVDELSNIVTKVLEESHAGDTEADIHKRIVSAARFAGADEVWGRVASGERLLVPGALPSDRILGRGDMVCIEYACTFHNYPARVCQMAVVGHPSASQREKYEHYVRTVEVILSQVGPNQPGQELYYQGRATLEKAKVGIRSPNVGYALGIGLYERPALQPQETLQTRPGMVLCVEVETGEGLKVGRKVEITENGMALMFGPLPSLGEILV